MKKSEYPKIYLVLDNCFAIKRWVKPEDWLRIINEIGGISCVQASTDNEIDPLFCTREYRNKWVQDVKEYGEKYKIKVFSFYSGYATYRTVGIAGPYKKERDKLRVNYFNDVVGVASELGAQVGNTLGAFSMPVLDSPDLFRKHEGYLEEALVKMAGYSQKKGVQFSYEQMYTPSQGFWTIEGTSDWIKRVYAKAKAPMYITIDTAHQVGQRYFCKPSSEELMEMVETGDVKDFRLGETLSGMIRSKKYDYELIKRTMDQYSYMFSTHEDSDVYQWFSSLGCYSPLVHLQQTDGTYSAHRPFTEVYNKNGIIDPKKVLQAIAKSYDSNSCDGMPPKVKEIYLAFEIFFSITEGEEKIKSDIAKSVEYWRKVIPKDGLRLDELI